METNNTILYQQEGSVARIILNRPEVYNSFTQEMMIRLQDVLNQAAADQTVRAVLLTGAGKAFCAGQDLGEVLEKGKQNQTTDSFTRVVEDFYNPIILKIRNMDKPIIAAVNGVAAGAGANVALACDIVVAAESAGFIQAFSKIGLIPDSGGTFFLPRLIGLPRATALMMLGDKISAAEAKEMGMIYACFADETFEAQAGELAAKLASMPTRGLAYTKQLLNHSLYNTLEEQLKEEGAYQQKAGMTTDYAEGVAAFLEKRKANFTGK